MHLTNSLTVCSLKSHAVSATHTWGAIVERVDGRGERPASTLKVGRQASSICVA
jgi:hypothetical protein